MLGVRVWLVGEGTVNNTSCCEFMVSPHPRTAGGGGAALVPLTWSRLENILPQSHGVSGICRNTIQEFGLLG